MRLHTPVARFATAIGLSLAVTCVIYVTIQANSGKGSTAEAGPRQAVLVAKGHIPAYQKLTASDVVLKQVPADLVPPGALREPGAAINRLTKQELFADEPLLDAKLVAAGQEYATVLPLPKGKRAVTVAVNEVVGVGGFVSVGSIVDVIATMEVDQKSVSRIILQGIQVLAAAQNPRKEDDPQAKVVSSVTLAVAPEQAEQLTLATEKGTIRLAMRSPLESGQVKTDGSTPSSLIGLKTPAPAPVQVAAKPAPVKTVYKVVHEKAPHVPAKVAPADPGIMLIRGTATTYVNR